MKYYRKYRPQSNALGKHTVTCLFTSVDQKLIGIIPTWKMMAILMTLESHVEQFYIVMIIITIDNFHMTHPFTLGLLMILITRVRGQLDCH